MTNKTKRTESKVSIHTVKAGDTMWFSGYWIKVTRIVDSTFGSKATPAKKLFGQFPYTPADKDVHMSWIFADLDRNVTVRS
jgi:hypothetical protein